MLRDQVPGALERRAVDPAGLEAEASSSLQNIFPTSRTPAKFCVPLLMLTTRSSSASASALCASTCATIARSSGVRAAGDWP